ncbi:capsid protein [Capybara genomovirus 2]|uniref:Capsid protein n=1 Tax=Capybara genomovirus 2 TaxID=2582941 RepID=A0A4P8W4H7_9VIRU|nr:capsid protein [Capybara genomovirus 2]QCS35882.1 capsid protein [Capybara genomovirus 2]
MYRRRTARPRYAKRPTRRFGRRRYAARSSFRRRAPMKKMTRISSRRVLNLTSQKKRDTMLVLTNAVAARTQPATYTANDPVLPGGGPPYIIPWVATARSSDTGPGNGQVNKFMESTRTASTCFMRGLHEKVNVQTNSSVPWQWRRVCFTAKSLIPNVPTSGQNFYWQNLTSNGYRRTVNELGGGALNALLSFVLKGTQGVDWDDPLIAPLDTKRITVRYDKLRTVQSGNNTGVIRQYKFWHPMNKNLVYDDDESGALEASNPYSVASKAGMGDFFVVDMFKPLGGSTASDTISFRPNSTLYWHEK